MEDTTIEDVLKTFEDYYVKKDFANALLVLQKHEKELPKDIWHYNVGTVQAKLENWPLARYHFLMAENQGLTVPELKQNKEVVETRLQVEKLERPLDVSDYVYQYASAASEGFFTTFSLLLLVMGLFILKRGASLLKVVALTVLVLLPLGCSWWVKTWPRAVVSSPQVVREGPSQIFAERQELPAGVLIIFRGSGDWKEIIWPSRYSGWILKNGLLELE